MSIINQANIISYTVDKITRNEAYISIQNGEVTVRAPWYYTANQIQSIVEAKKKWILEKLQESKKRENYTQGREVEIFGQKYETSIEYKMQEIPELSLEEKNIKIKLPIKYKNIDKEEIVEKIIEKMYQQIAIQEIEKVMEKTRKQLKFAPEDYEITKLKEKIAKCTEEKKIYIDYSIVKYEKEIVEYIILHQYMHLKYKNHTKKFYEEIEKYQKNYKQIEKTLEKKAIKI